MARTVRKPKAPVTPGRRIGTKRRDMRWEAEGQVWDSRFEYEVFRGYRDAGIKIRRCTEADSLRYTAPVRNGVCTECHSRGVVTEHTYTPDFFVSVGEANARGAANTGVSSPGYYLEVKGYLRADRRSLLRALRKALPDVDLRLIAQRDYRVTKQLNLIGWAGKFLKCPAVVWSGGVPRWLGERK